MSARHQLALGALLSPLGVLLCLAGPEWLGAAVLLAGLAIGLNGLHRFGRGGSKPDATL